MDILKNQGNEFFKNNEFEKANELYLKALLKCEEEIKNLTEMDKFVCKPNNEVDNSDTEDEEDASQSNTTDHAVEDVIIELKEKKSVLNSNICLTYCSLKNYGKAIEYAIDSTKFRPKWFKSWYRLSTVLYHLERYEQALTTIDKSIECAENNEDNESEVLLTEKYGFLFDLKYQIEDKILVENKKSKSKEKINPVLNDLFNDKEINDKINNSEFQEKFKNFESNPMGMLNDPEMVNLMGNLVNKIDKDKLANIFGELGK